MPHILRHLVTVFSVLALLAYCWYLAYTAAVAFVLPWVV